MRKKPIPILILAALSAMAISGCKKREPVDLSSLHTTEAVETESMKETSPVKQTDAPSEAVSQAPSDSAALKTELKTEQIGSSSVQYPQISGMKDSSRQEEANAILKNNALAVAKAFPDQTFSVRATVEAVNLKRVTVSYRGSAASGSGGEERFFYTNTLDLDTMENLGLSDFTDAYTVAGYIVSGDYKLSDAAGNEEGIRSELNASDRTVEYYYNKLKAADFSAGGEGWPEIFSYEKQGVVYVSLPVSQAAGGYVLIHYSPDNK